MKVQFSLKGVGLYFECEEIPEIYSDKKRIQQILFNLVSNALKFTSKGQVRVKVRKMPVNRVLLAEEEEEEKVEDNIGGWPVEKV